MKEIAFIYEAGMLLHHTWI